MKTGEKNLVMLPFNKIFGGFMSAVCDIASSHAMSLICVDTNKTIKL
jgi:acyl-coenzyme A thioesterase PaaI-like protein